MSMNSTHALLLFCFVFLLAACSPTGEIKKGQTAYDLKKYKLATELFEQEFDKASEEAEKGEIAYKIAESYRKVNNTEAAEEWYLKASNFGVKEDARFWYARMLQANQKYDQAIIEYEAIIKEEPYRRPELSDAIKSCKKAKVWISEEQHTTIENLEQINSRQSEFAPVFYRDGRLVFTSNRSSATGEDKDKWTGRQFFDLYVTPGKRQNGFGKPEPFSAVLNGPYNDGPAAFNASYNALYYTHCGTDRRDNNDFCGLWSSQRAPEGGWADPVPVKLFPDSINSGQPAISPDGETLVLAADDPQGYGSSDLYYSKRTIEGWSTPVNLGSRINTEYEESFPSFDEDGNLYFSSDGHAGMGGLDIFKAEKEGNNKWVRPEQLPYPINSAADDLGILPIELSDQEKINFYMKGYISSSRPGGLGGDDIYYFERAKPPATFELIATINTPTYADSLDPDSDITGTEPLKGATLVIRPGKGDSDTLYTDDEGIVAAPLSASTDYNLFVSSGNDYFNETATASTKPIEPLPGEHYTVEKEITLERIFREKEIVIPNIYYDFNKWDIRDDAAAVLDTTIYQLLVDNPNLVIELGSHTDARGSDQFNKELSEKRAQAVVDYLVKKGIDRERLEAKGYGETQLVNECDDGVECTEEEHQRNRRTTFRVLGADFEAESVEPGNIKVDPKEE